MKAPRFWWRPSRGIAALALSPIGRLYGRAAARRIRRPASYRSSLPVVCVGNFTVGGDGKTPMALAIAAIILADGKRPGFLTRGYGGSADAVLIDLARDDADDTGDEARLLAAVAPTAVSVDRIRGARLLEAAGIDVIIMDDGLQNPALGKDLSFVVVDAGVGLGNGLVTPAGPLRAPLPAQMALADVVVLVGEGNAELQVRSLAETAGKPMLRAKLQPVDAERWRGKCVHAFAGIGRPEKFFASLQSVGAEIVARSAFADHHRYTETEARQLIRSAELREALPVTTAKDHARLAGAGGIIGSLRDRAEVFDVRLEFAAPDALRPLLAEAIKRTAVRAG
jgi:tetraacyldisaccharide 4'-kinase